MKAALILLFVLLIPSYVHSGTGKFTKHFENSFFMPCEKGEYSAELIIKDLELKIGKNSFEIIIHDKKDTDVTGAAIDITPWMPDMGHGVVDKATVTEKGRGLYEAQNVVLNMGGLWELKIRISRDGIEDLCVFTFPKVKSASTESSK